MSVNEAISEIKPITPANELDHMDRLPLKLFCDVVNAVASDQDQDRVQVTVSGTASLYPLPDERNGQSCAIEASFILAADGANSFVRKALDTSLRGLGLWHMTNSLSTLSKSIQTMT